jgi:hypothetical protein
MLEIQFLAWTSNIRSLNIKKTMTYDVGNPVPCLDLKLQIMSKQGTGFPTSYVIVFFMFNDLKFEVQARNWIKKTMTYDVGNLVPCLDLKLQIIKHIKDYDI